MTNNETDKFVRHSKPPCILQPSNEIATKASYLHPIDRLQFPWLTASRPNFKLEAKVFTTTSLALRERKCVFHNKRRRRSPVKFQLRKKAAKYLSTNAQKMFKNREREGKRNRKIGYHLSEPFFELSKATKYQSSTYLLLLLLLCQ